MATLQELRELSSQELRNRATELKQTLFDLKSKKNTGVLESTASLTQTRREIARCLTVAAQKDAVAAAKAKE